MKKIFIVASLFTMAVPASGQVSQESELYKTILNQDSLLFNVGFNTCDIKQFENLLSDRFEFFHDIDSFSDKKKFLADIRNGLCSNPGSFQARRELIPGSTEVFALHNKHNQGKLYGAIQVGVHQFFETHPGKPAHFGSSARFTHVWLLENGVWKLTKSFSYEHQDKQLSETNRPNFNNDSAIGQWLRENKVPALGLGVIKNGKLQQVRVWGELSKGNTAPYNTIFNVASLTKPVTALVALKLVSQKKWGLDEPLYPYWTDPQIAGDPRHKKLTTRIVLSHQTGFPNWRWMNEDKKLSFQFEPGTKYQYSGEGFEYLRKALEKKFHKSIQQLADELIFQPLNMKDTRYIWDKYTDTARVATGYDKDGKAYNTTVHTTPNAADDLLTTIEDYSNFLVNVMNNTLLSEPVFAAMKANQVDTKKGKYFGLGFEVYDLGNNNIALSHGGSDFGTSTITFILPKTGEGLVIFTNSDNGTNLYEHLLKQYLGENGTKIFEIETR